MINSNDNRPALYSNGINDSNGAASPYVTVEHDEPLYAGAPNGNGYSTAHSNTRSLSERQIPPPPPLAIVGMGLRLPGGAMDPNSFWDLLVNKRDGRIPIPQDRYNVDAFYSPHGKQGTIAMDHGYFLKDTDLAQMDAGFFSMSKAEVERLDPSQRLLLEVVYEAFENSGEKNWRGQNIGCYVGVFGEDWLDLHSKDTQDFGMYRITGNGDFLLGNRVSYEYDLHGPSMTVKVGCSSSMVCLHLASEAIYRGECTSAIIGGTNLLMSPVLTVAMCEQGALSPDASCKSFDASANGYARADAINAIYIKRLDDAIRDGNPVRAVIRATSSNCDGKTPGISNPSSEAHERLIRRAYEVAGLRSFSETAMVECHGTGTAVGDPLEVHAVASVFGEDGVYIGSVKPNVGHSEGASGITSIIKSVLSLENKTIVPNIKFQTPNPKIPFEKAKLTIPVDLTPWPENRYERISVNSFGIGGANAHVILDSAASFGLERKKKVENIDEQQSEPRLLVFSANHPDSLKKITENYEKYLDCRPSLKDLAFTLGDRREHHIHKAFCVTDGSKAFEFLGFSKSDPSARALWVFTGQGAQWPEMGKELLNDYPLFKANIKAMDEILSSLNERPSWKIEDELMKDKLSSSLDKAEFAQPLCTAIQIALVNLLQSWGISPAGVVGHSSGEIAAAYAAGAITQRESIIIAFYRGYITKGQKRDGGMAAVGLGRQEVAPYMVPGVVIACENSPHSVTLSGDVATLDTVIAKIKEDRPDVLARRLRVEMAYHSHHMQEFGEVYQNFLERHVESSSPRIPFHSSVTGKKYLGSGDLGPSYWRRNLESPVLFYSAIKSILDDPDIFSLHLEIGPHSALAGPLRQILKEASKSVPYVSSLTRNSNGTTSLLTAIGNLYCHGINIDFASMNEGGKVLPDLPVYAWYHEKSYWQESRLSREWRLRKFPHHDILGSRVAEGGDLEPTWRNVLRLNSVPWVADHLVHTDIVFPAAGYVAIAGEAARQLTGQGDYTVRDVTISSAMVLHLTNPTEVITSLRPSKLTAYLDSVWYDFTIVSHNGSSWIKHCSGQVTGGPASSSYPVVNVESLPREVPSPRWYDAMKKVGLNYGPAFVGLKNISAGVTKHSAAASLFYRPEAYESPYQLHPVALDLIFQLLSVSVYNGQPRKFDQLCLPTYIGELYVAGGASDTMQVHIDTKTTPRRIVTGNGHGMIDGKLAFHLKGMKLSPLGEQENDSESNPHAAVELEWRPDINFLDAKTLMRPSRDVQSAHILVETLCILCAVDTIDILGSLSTPHDYLEKYLTWMKAYVDGARQGQSVVVKDASQLLALDSPSRRAMIEKLTIDSQSTEGAAVGTAISRIYKSARGIFEAKVDPLELLLQDNILTDLYNFADLWDYGEFFKLLSHSKPNLRILEIGAGTGSITATILKHLQSQYGERMYSKYTYTDISAGFFVAAKERFREYSEVDYAVLDITQDPVGQGFSEGSYDLVVAANVLHATPSLNETLKNVRKLLKPQGQLFLQELCCTSKWTNYVMGVLSGWWLGGPDGRHEEPYVSPERWDKELRNAGFGGTETVFRDHEAPYQINANILAKPVENISIPSRVTLLTHPNITPTVRAVEANLRDKGLQVDFCTLTQDPKANQDIISLLDIDEPFLARRADMELTGFLKFMSALKGTQVLWVTRSAQVGCTDPRYAMIIGLSRTIRSELSIPFATLELDKSGSDAFSAIWNVFKKLQRTQEDTSELDRDYEFVLSDGLVNIGRFHWISVSKELALRPEKGGPKALEIGKRGLLQTLQWVQRPWVALGAYEVEVDVRAIGMNFKDVLIAMGIVDGRDEEGNSLGCECAGVIRKVGSNVRHLKEGDRVMVFSAGSFCTRMRTPSRLATKIPDSLTFEDAATMPCVYTTVLRSLIDIGRLTKGQTILIHSAAGGVGIAAIQVAQMIGAEIYVTVGTENKAAFITTNYAIASDHIFDSRSESFLADIMSATNGKGVDLVLNSLSGELLHASWKCVAEYGMMVEIGKRDLIGRGKLNLDIFEANRGYCGVDIAQVCAEKPELTTRLLNQTIELYEKGAIKPIHPITTFDAVAIEDAFRFLQKGQHIGKIVVKVPANSDELPTATVSQSLVLRPEASYLLVGGLGGLGKAVATWLAEHGAKHLIFLSRSAGKTAADSCFIKELEAMGCSVNCVAGSVSDIATVQIAVKIAPYPIAGVLQMSMVLRDRAFAQMTLDDWLEVMGPKFQGTWNLHQAIPQEWLDFFVLFSSFSGLVGQWGQANYAASNTFLDAFVQYRQGLGHPASVLAIGCMEDVGYISQNPSVLENFRASAVHMLREQDLLDSLQLVISRSSTPPLIPCPSTKTGFVNKSQVAIGLRSTMPLSDPSNRNIWKRDPRMAVYRNAEETTTVDSSSADEGLKRFLASVSTNPSKLDEKSSVDFLAHEIGISVYSFLMKSEAELDISQTLAAMGVDSLTAIEVRNWWKQNLGLEVTVLEMLNGGSIYQLGELAAQRLKEKHGNSSGNGSNGVEIRETGDTYLVNKAL